MTQMVQRKDIRKMATELVGRLRSIDQNATAQDVEFESKPTADALSIVYDAIDSTVAGVIITDVNGTITYANPSFQKMFGYEKKREVYGLNAADLFPGKAIRHISDVQAMIDISEGETEEFTVQTKDGDIRHVEVSASTVRSSEGRLEGRMVSFVDITKRKRLEQEQETLIQKLQDALDKIKTLRGLIPICAACKNIRDDKGYWHRVEAYIMEHAEVRFSHGICPDCIKKLDPELDTEEFSDSIPR